MKPAVFVGSSEDRHFVVCTRLCVVLALLVSDSPTVIEITIWLAKPNANVKLSYCRFVVSSAMKHQPSVVRVVTSRGLSRMPSLRSSIALGKSFFLIQQ